MNYLTKIFCGAAAALSLMFVSCKPSDVPVSGVSLSQSSVTLVEGETCQLDAVVAPENATNKNVTWNSSNEGVASVSGGKITAVSAGEAVITVATEDAGRNATCRVTVNARIIAVESVSLDQTALEMTVGDVADIQATVLPADATDKSVIWTSSDESVAAASVGQVEALAAGYAVITVTTADGGMYAECEVTVAAKEMPARMLEVETLPDIVARSGHVMFYDKNGSLVVAGGHESGFSPTSSAQILEGDGWTEFYSYYTHDLPFSLVLSSGEVMIGGGCSGGGGTGASEDVDIYNPETRTFSDGPRMVFSRNQCHAVELTNGDVVVSGNWYSTDAVEKCSPSSRYFEQIAEVSQSRLSPYLFETSENKGVVFGCYANYGGTYSFGNISVDRFDGTSYYPELFNEWIPDYCRLNFRPEDYKIGDYTYFLVGVDAYENRGLMKLCGEEFSMVETDFLIPSVHPVNGSSLGYYTLVVDKEENKAHIVCTADNLYSLCVFTIDYAPALNGGVATVSFSYTEQFSSQVSAECCCLTPDGNIAVSGGIYDSNFYPFSCCHILKP